MQNTDAVVTPKVWKRTAMSNRPKWKIFWRAGSASMATRFGAAVWPGGDADHIRRAVARRQLHTHRRSRRGTRPSVSVSMAIAPVLAGRIGRRNIAFVVPDGRAHENPRSVYREGPAYTAIARSGIYENASRPPVGVVRVKAE